MRVRPRPVVAVLLAGSMLMLAPRATAAEPPARSAGQGGFDVVNAASAGHGAFGVLRAAGQMRTVPGDSGRKLVGVPPLGQSRRFAATPGEELHDLTLVHTGRDGSPSTEHYPFIIKTDGQSEWVDVPPDGKLRLPRGEYLVSTKIYGPGGDVTDLVWPRLKLTGDHTVALDARLGRPLTVTVPDPAATSFLAEVVVNVPTDDGLGITVGTVADSFEQQYVAQLGPPGALAGMTTRIGSQWSRGPDAYRLAWFSSGRLPTGFHREVRPAELATVRAGYAAGTPGSAGQLAAFARNDAIPSGGFVEDVRFPLPTTRTEHYNVEPGVVWENNFGEVHHGTGTLTNQLWGAGHYRPGHTYRETWNRGILGPAFSGIRTPDRNPEEVARSGDTINVNLPLYSDTPSRYSWPGVSSGTISLHRDGNLFAEVPSLTGTFAVPAAEAGYRLRIEARRGKPADLAVHTVSEWSFRSGASPGRTTRLPVSVIRFTPALDDHQAAPAGRTVRFPVRVHGQPGAATAPLSALTVDVSYDDGKTWTRAKLTRSGDGGLVTLHHPRSIGYVSLRATAADTAGNTVEQTVVRAYRLAPGQPASLAHPQSK